MTLRSFQKLLWTLVGVAVLAFTLLLLWTDYRADRNREGAQQFSARFELTDHTGMVRTPEDFSGRWMLVFFGFANCPDVCPTTLADVAAVMEDLGESAGSVQPLFISIDPARDTPKALAEFIPRFEAGIIGLTGTPKQIERTAENFYIFYEKIEEAAAPSGYTMGHSSQLFLFGPDAGYVMSWQYGTPIETILADLRQRI